MINQNDSDPEVIRDSSSHLRENISSNNDSSLISESRKNDQSQNLLSILPYDQFQNLKHPLDVIEQIYSPIIQISDIYSINDLKGQEPYCLVDLLSDKELIISALTIKYLRLSLIMCIVKIFISPFTVIVDLLGISAIRTMDLERIKVYSVLITFFVASRIACCAVIVLYTSDRISLGFAVWIIFGEVIEVPLCYILWKVYSDIKDFKDDELEIIEFESFKHSFCFKNDDLE